MAKISKQDTDNGLDTTSHKTLKSYWVKARGMGISGLGYIEGMCHEHGILGFAQDSQLAAQLVLENYWKHASVLHGCSEYIQCCLVQSSLPNSSK
ncbi:MAG: hypothetical protein U5L01_03420 [Rheinheimera sp.]|nr:hypothetical protein [Rheinheimera sp.]